MSEKFEKGITPEGSKEKFYVFVELGTRDFEYEVHASSEEEAEKLAEQAINEQGLKISNIEVNEKALNPDHIDGKLGDETKESQKTYYVFVELGTKGLNFEVIATSEEKAEQIAADKVNERGLKVAYVEANKQPPSPMLSDVEMLEE